MAQFTEVIPDSDGATFLTNLNNSNLSLASSNAGASAPQSPAVGMLWYNTALDTLYVRNAGNTAWDAILNGSEIGANVVHTIRNSPTWVFNAEGALTGAFKLQINGLYAKTLSGGMNIQITQNNTTDGQYTDIQLYIAGNWSSSDHAWHNTKAYMKGATSPININVSFTTDGTDAHIVIGDISSTWMYPRLVITDILLNAIISGYQPDFTISAITSYPSIQNTITTTYQNIGSALTFFAPLKGIFGYGWNGSSYLSMTNLVSNTGVISADTTGVGTARYQLAACSYGTTGTGIFGYGSNGSILSMTNLVSNTGAVANDTTGVGTARYLLAACSYGTDKGIFGYGYNGSYLSMTNLVSNTGAVANDITGVGTARNQLAACGYGIDKGVFGYGSNDSILSITNLVSNTGVVANDTTGVGTARYLLAACSYGTDKGIFGYGWNGSSHLSITNLVSNTGVISADITGVGTARAVLAACSYGADKGIFGYGSNGSYLSMTNLVSNTGVVANDTTGVGTARNALAACGYA